MLNPSIDDLVKKVGNRYALCILAAKRARFIINGDDDSIDFDIDKPLSIAIDEIMSDEVTVNIPEEPLDRI